jgi:riboflavin kinase/FMN adenylyltransferase
MKPIHTLSDFPSSGKPVVLAMGCFDGVHIGHQQVIATAVEQARARGGEAWVYTFSPHPAKVLSPETAPPLISAAPCRLRQFAALGVQGVLEIPFDKTFAHIEPEPFLSTLHQQLPGLSGLVCGTDWSFGYRARGKFHTLEAFCKEHGMTATAVHPVLCDGERVSSTRIRQAARSGDIPLAQKLLGRPFCIFGTVVKGRGIGRGLGFPTANMDPENELIPAPGVYAAYVIVDSQRAKVQSPRTPAAVFIGERKTFNDPEPVVEAYLLDFDGDLYGEKIEACLVRKIRDVQAFPSREKLIEQIERDILTIRRGLSAQETV